MIEYLPWSEATHKNSLTKYKEGVFSSLDVELGGECNYHCVYCDSPDRKKLCSIPLEGLEHLLSTGSFDWVYVCGLGEPTFNGNYEKLITLLNYCKKYNVKCSTFTNLSRLTSELISFIREEILYLFFKYDSFESSLGQALYGTRSVKEQLNNIKKTKDLVIANGGATNLAASIVPTRLNKGYIAQIVEECLSAQIYPLLGELESSGKGETNYENLCLSKDELLQIKNDVEHLCGGSYLIPICPSVISGIHFSHDSYITVDQFSGLSCHWFWLEEPKTKRLIKYSASTPLAEMSESILEYRDERLPSVKEFLSRNDEVGLAFGGCGGNANQIFSQYLMYHRG